MKVCWDHHPQFVPIGFLYLKMKPSIKASLAMKFPKSLSKSTIEIVFCCVKNPMTWRSSFPKSHENPGFSWLDHHFPMVIGGINHWNPYFSYVFPRFGTDRGRSFSECLGVERGKTLRNLSRGNLHGGGARGPPKISRISGRRKT